MICSNQTFLFNKIKLTKHEFYTEMLICYNFMPFCVNCIFVQAYSDLGRTCYNLIEPLDFGQTQCKNHWLSGFYNAKWLFLRGSNNCRFGLFYYLVTLYNTSIKQLKLFRFNVTYFVPSTFTRINHVVSG